MTGCKSCCKPAQLVAVSRHILEDNEILISRYRELIKQLKEKSIAYEEKQDLESLKEFYTFVVCTLKGY